MRGFACFSMTFTRRHVRYSLPIGPFNPRRRLGTFVGALIPSPMAEIRQLNLALSAIGIDLRAVWRALGGSWETRRRARGSQQ